MTSSFDLPFYFDPVCPFAWLTSKWVRMVSDQRGYRVDWRLISLRIVNEAVDYAAHFPPEYEAGHTAGLKRSLRERPQLVGLGVDPDSIGVEDDWHGGSRRTKK